MKNIISLIVFVFIFSFVKAQPCKQVKTGMSPGEVLKLVGKPTEIDTLGSDNNMDGSISITIVWQYGVVRGDNNQRVEFTDNKVDNVIADGRKYDELMMAFKNGNVLRGELTERIEKINKEGCR